MIELEGLGLELRKAAKRIRDCQDCGNRECQKDSHTITSELWLPAGLVAQDRQRIKQRLIEEIKRYVKGARGVAKAVDNVETKSDMRAYEDALLLVLRKVEEAFGK